MLSPEGGISLECVANQTEPTALLEGSVEVFGRDFEVAPGIFIPAGTRATVAIHEPNDLFITLDLDRDIPGWGDYVEIWSDNDLLIEALNAGRAMKRHKVVLTTEVPETRQ
jgi:hypothetical protein